jgi:hypothetical protein
VVCLVSCSIIGVEKETWSAGFLLAAPAALQLVAQLEQQLGVSLRQAKGMINAAEEGTYLSVQAVSIPTGEGTGLVMVLQQGQQLRQRGLVAHSSAVDLAGYIKLDVSARQQQQRNGAHSGIILLHK